MTLEELLKILACPKCLGDLQPMNDNGNLSGFACRNCNIVYPVEDEIPVMLIEEAIPISDWDKGIRKNTKDNKKKS